MHLDFFFEFLEGMSPFCGATDTPILIIMATVRINESEQLYKQEHIV